MLLNKYIYRLFVFLLSIFLLFVLTSSMSLQYISYKKYVIGSTVTSKERMWDKLLTYYYSKLDLILVSGHSKKNYIKFLKINNKFNYDSSPFLDLEEIYKHGVGNKFHGMSFNKEGSLLIWSALRDKNNTMGVAYTRVNRVASEIMFVDNLDILLLNGRGKPVIGNKYNIYKPYINNIAGYIYNDTGSLQRIGSKTYCFSSLSINNYQGYPIGIIFFITDISSEANFFISSILVFLVQLAILFIVIVLLGKFLLFLRLSSVNSILNYLNIFNLNKIPSTPKIEELSDENFDKYFNAINNLKNIHLENYFLFDERERSSQLRAKLVRAQLERLAEVLDKEDRRELIKDIRKLNIRDNNDCAHMGPASLAQLLDRFNMKLLAQNSRIKKVSHDLQLATMRSAQLSIIKRELDIARMMQQNILPPSEFSRKEVEIYATMIPAMDVGGDFYEYIVLDDDRILLTIADVSGKGISSAFFMATVRTILASIAKDQVNVESLVNKANKFLCDSNNPKSMFVTSFISILDIKTGKLDFINAGHPAPFIIRNDSNIYEDAYNEVMMLRSKRQIPLAVDHFNYKSEVVYLNQGDILVLYTDGITEKIDHYNKIVGDVELIEILKRVDLNSHTKEIMEYMLLSLHSSGQITDDTTCMLVKLK